MPDTPVPGSTPPTAEAVSALMPQLKADLARLVAIPSVSVLGYPEHTRPALVEHYDALVELLRDAGVEQISSLDLPDTAPILTAEIPAPEIASAQIPAAEIAATRRMLETIREVFERYGFEPVETPAFEYTDALGKFLNSHHEHAHPSREEIAKTISDELKLHKQGLDWEDQDGPIMRVARRILALLSGERK